MSTATPPLHAPEADRGTGLFSYTLKRSSGGQLVLSWFLVVLMTVFVITIPFAVWLLVLMFRSPNFSGKARAKRIDLYEHGLVLLEQHGPVAVFRFDSVAVRHRAVNTYVYGMKTSTRYLLSLVGPDGRTVKINQRYEGVDHLGRQIQDSVVRHQFGPALATVEAGYPAAFGPFTVTREGLVADGKGLVTWPLLDRITLSQGIVRIHVHGKRMQLVARQVGVVPNLALFLTLVSQLRSGVV